MKLKSQILTSSNSFKENVKKHLKDIENIGKIAKLNSLGGPESSRDRHIKRGKMLPRDRVSGLLDVSSYFLEIGSFAAQDLYDGAAPGAGLIAGIGTIEGQACMIICNDATVKGGTYFPLSVKKHLRAQEIAERCHLPCLYLVDSGGANLPNQDEVFPDRDHFGRIFIIKRECLQRYSANCSCNGFLHCWRSLCARDVGCNHNRQKSGNYFLAGPPLVKAATGEVVNAEDLGGGDIHTKSSGVADYLADDDRQALAMARRAIKNLNRKHPEPVKLIEAKEPDYDPNEIIGIVPHDLRTIYDVREIIARLVDGSEFDEFKSRFGETLVTGFAHIMGCPVGIIANNGVLFSESAQKGAHFIELCSQRKIPLIFLQNISGFMVGKKYENEGIARMEQRW